MRNDEKKRIEFLVILYQMAGGNLHQGVLDDELAERVGMETTEFRRHAVYLKEESLVKFQTLSSISITHAGIKAVERIMEEEYRKTKRRVLETIADMSRMTDVVIFQDLAARLG